MATPPSLKTLTYESIHENRPRLLCIEGDATLAHLFKQRMEQEGFVVDLALNGADGVALLEQRPYDLVVLDYTLPELNGLQILRRLAANELRPPAIMVTAEDDAAVVIDAMRLGVADFVIKTADAGHLQLLPAIIERVLSQHRRFTEREAIVEDLYGQNRKLALLNRATQIFTSTLDEEQIALQLVKSICEFTDAEGSSVWLLTHGKGGEELLECVAIFANGEYIEPRHVPLAPGEGIAGWAFAHRETVIVNDVMRDRRFSAASDDKLKFQTRTLLAAPMRAPERVVGVLELVNKRKGVFTDIDQTLSETLAASAAIAIENARYFQHLNRQAEELRLRNEELDAFAHTVAHDLKTPLSVIAGYADMLRENFEFLHPEEADLYLKQIVDNSMRMNHIIDSLLLLAGVRGTTNVEIELVDMGMIVQEALSRIEFMSTARGAVIDLPDQWPAALGYGPWLEEVWYNYVVNALKYGGEPPVLRLGYDFPEPTKVRFWVADNGPGVPADSSFLFKPMLRMQTNERRKGYGLGLSIVKRIIEKLNGEVGAESLPEGGSRFYFTLPAVV
ncbi:MAG: response regulator [Caldilinea sp.]|nr:response regulator [Caldilinea sp.]MDW8441286.1 response regulator [Caldilineaceae bacterium]